MGSGRADGDRTKLSSMREPHGVDAAHVKRAETAGGGKRTLLRRMASWGWLGGRKAPITAPVAMLMKRVTAMKETSYNVEAKGE